MSSRRVRGAAAASGADSGKQGGSTCLLRRACLSRSAAKRQASTVAEAIGRLHFFSQKIILRADLGEVGNGVCPSIGPVFLGLWAAAVIHGAGRSSQVRALPRHPHGISRTTRAGFFQGGRPVGPVYRQKEAPPAGWMLHTRCSIHCKQKTLYTRGFGRIQANFSCIHERF